MRIRALIAGTAAAATLGLSASGASADTLFTTTSHLTRVAVGTTASVTSGTVTAFRDGTVVNSCASSTLNLTLEQNDAAAVAGTFTGGTFDGCSLSAAGDFPWRFTVRGTGIQTASPASTLFTNVTWDDVTATLWGVSPGAGTLVDANATGLDGASVREGANHGSGICFTLNNAGTLSGPLLADGAIDANYCLEGATATAWSLGTTAVPTGPVGLYTSSTHATRVPVGTTARMTGASTFVATVGQQVPFFPCASSSLTFLLSANSPGGEVQGTVTSASFNMCGAPPPTSLSLPWTVSIAGARWVSGTTVTYPNTHLTGFALDYSAFGSVTGSLTSSDTSLIGVYASQPTSGTAPVCLELNNAGDMRLNPGALAVQLDGRFCFADGAASTWSLT